jgi:uncharacterized protein
MNKHLSDLIELSAVDTAIDDFDIRVDDATSKLKAIQANKDELTKRIDDLKHTIKEEKVKIERTDLHLKELQDKLSKLGSRGANIKTEKEMKALALEEEIAKEQVSFANDEIARLEKSIATKTENVAKIEEELIPLDADLAAEAGQTNSKLELVEKEKKEAFEKREKIISSMDQKIITYYQKIKRWAKNTTVVPVKKQACYGCYMKLNDNTFKEVKKGAEIVSCPHCGRIMYYVEEQEQA